MKRSPQYKIKGKIAIRGTENERWIDFSSFSLDCPEAASDCKAKTELSNKWAGAEWVEKNPVIEIVSISGSSSLCDCCELYKADAKKGN